jgi:YgiT-type zinc finger domain-containing protein
VTVKDILDILAPGLHILIVYGFCITYYYYRLSSRPGALVVGFSKEEVTIRCILCRQGKTRAGQVTVMQQRGDTIVIIKEVPADVCENCGEYYLSKEVTSLVLKKGEEAVRKGAKLKSSALLRDRSLEPSRQGRRRPEESTSQLQIFPPSRGFHPDRDSVPDQ